VASWLALITGEGKVHVLSIQSQVVYGHVGNAAAAFALQRQGVEVWPLPTAVLAHHAGYGSPPGRHLGSPQARPPGRVSEAAEITALVDGIAARGALRQCTGVLTGWVGTAANGEAALAAVAQVKAANPRALYLCDPVIGDEGKGMYVPPDVAAFFRDRAAPAADVLTPNRFELAWLSGQDVTDPDHVIMAAHRLLERGPRLVVCTSVPLPATPGLIGALACSRDGAWLATTEELRHVPSGAGDLFAALLLAQLLKGRNPKKALAFAVAATFGVLRRSQGAGELHLVAAQDELVRPSTAPDVARVS
jgi:pyridoxine kinase